MRNIIADIPFLVKKKKTRFLNDNLPNYGKSTFCYFQRDFGIVFQSRSFLIYGKGMKYYSIILILQKEKSDESLRLKFDSSLVLRQYDNTTDKFRFIEEFRKDYRPAEILIQLRLKNWYCVKI